MRVNQDGRTYEGSRYEYEHSDELLWEICSKIHVAESPSPSPKDKEMIFEKIRTLLPGGVDELNQIVKYAAYDNYTSKHPELFCAVCGDRAAKEIVFSNPETDLPMVTSGGFLELLKEFLNQRIDLVDVLFGWRTILIEACCEGGKLKCVDYLLSTARASVDIVNGDGDTALIVGVQYNSFECMKYLISFGADLNIVNNKGNTALLEAIKFDNFYLLSVLSPIKLMLLSLTQMGKPFMSY